MIERLRRSRIAFKLYEYGLVDIDSIYASEYYASMDRETAIQDANQLADTIIDIYSPDNVIEFGCGTGRLLYRYTERGITVYGIDASSSALEQSKLPDECLQQHDLTQPFSTEEKYDIALAIEILEHLPQKAADTVVDSISNAAKTVLVSAATPGQGGTHHVNEQPHAYWIEKFETRGMTYQPSTTEKIRSQLKLDDLMWISDNLIVFKKDE